MSQSKLVKTLWLVDQVSQTERNVERLITHVHSLEICPNRWICLQIQSGPKVTNFSWETKNTVSDDPQKFLHVWPEHDFQTIKCTKIFWNEAKVRADCQENETKSAGKNKV